MAEARAEESVNVPIEEDCDPNDKEGVLSESGSDNDDFGVHDDIGMGNLRISTLLHESPSIESLPVEVQRRIRSLKNNQVDIFKSEAKFLKDLHELEMKHLVEMEEFVEKRKEIINGGYEPTDAEADYPPGCFVNNAGGEENGVGGQQQEDGVKTKGIPSFWLTVLRNVELLNRMLDERDLPVLEFLTDIKLELTEVPMGFHLHFHFAPNEYFTDSILTKKYITRCDVDPDEPLLFDGTEIVDCKGCSINWNDGKNVTTRTTVKRQRHKQSGFIRTVGKIVKARSFFNFFNSPQMPTDLSEMNDDLYLDLLADFEIGEFIRDRIVNRAVLYYTGEALDDDDLSVEEEEEEEEEDESADLQVQPSMVNVPEINNAPV